MVGEDEKWHTTNELYNCFIIGFKFIMFYHILFHSERGERVHIKRIMCNCFVTSFKFIMFYHILFHLTCKQLCKDYSSYAASICL